MVARRGVLLAVSGVVVVATALLFASRPADTPPRADAEEAMVDEVPRRAPVPVIPAPAPPEPVEDPDGPGTLLSVEPLELPAGVFLDPEVEVSLIRYVTRGPGGALAESTGLLFVPGGDRDEPVPLVAMGHGSTGIAQQCAPSLSPRPLATIPGVARALDEGWAVVATDYVGLGTPGPHPYLVGDSSSSAILDSIMAAGAVVDVDPHRTVIWGYSQGGHAALHAADDLANVGGPPVAGVVAFAPVTDLRGVVDASHGTTLGTLFLVTTAVSWSEVYDELDLADVVPEPDRDIALALARRCLDPVSIPVALLEALILRDGLVHPADVPDGTWDPFLDLNTPPGGADVPILVLHGALDEVISPVVTEEHVVGRCARGGEVEFQLVPLVGHLTIVNQVVDDAVAWTRLRFAGEPVADACPERGTGP